MVRKNIKGFTLVEIMIVVAVIALLASLLIPNLVRARIQANESSAQATLKNISTAFETYAAVNNAYPTVVTDLLTATPVYLSEDYFSGSVNGYSYTINTLSSYTYSVTASPISTNLGVNSYTITTGGIMNSN